MLSYADGRPDPSDSRRFQFKGWNYAIRGRAIIDATRPFHWKERFQKVNAPTPEMRKEAWDKWGHLRD